MYNKLRNFFNKASHIYALIAVFLGIISLTVLASYALDTKVTSQGATNTADHILNFELNTTTTTTTKSLTIASGEVKLIDIVLTSAYSYNIKYSLYYTVSSGTESESTILGILNTSACDSSGTISSDVSCTVTLVAVNKSTSSITYTIGTLTGYENGGDLTPTTGKLIDYVYSFPNAPNLQGNMIPVVYDEDIGNWVKADSTNTHSDYYWYEYSTKRWANAILPLSSMVIDISNNQQHGSFYSGANTGGTITNEIASFKGATSSTSEGETTYDGDYLDCGYANYDFGNSISYVIRVRVNELNTIDYTNTGYPITHIIGNQNAAGGGLEIASTGNLSFVLSSSTYEGTSGTVVGAYESISTYFQNLGSWCTIVATYDGTTMELYVNGKLVAENTASMSIKVSDQPIVIAANPEEDGTYLNHANMDVKEVLVFDRALTETEIKKNYSDANLTVEDSTSLLLHYDFSEGNDIPVGTVIGDSEAEGVGGFYTWIPRYKYKVWNIEKTAGATQTETSKNYAYDALNEGIDIIFETGTESTGSIKCNYTPSLTPANAGQLSEICIGSNGDYYTHPSFTFGDAELTGFWMGKFETTGTNLLPTILPNVSPLVYLNLYKIHQVGISLNTSSNYKISETTLDSHVAKNTDWGAAAYLTHSQYGLCYNNSCSTIGLNNYENDSTYITGCGAAEGTSASNICETYNTTTGQLASTTGNIYGIYDMSGGAREYVMGVMYSSSTGILSPAPIGSENSGFNGPLPDGNSTYTEGIDYPDSKYYDSYAYGTERDNSQLSLNRGKLGDATSEVAAFAGTSITGSWQEDYSAYMGIGEITAGYAFYRRGGDSENGNNNGIFSYYSASGLGADYTSFRMVLT